MSAAPLTHDAAAAAARKYADRATARDRRRTGKQGPPIPWITLYMAQYRRLTGRKRYAGPRPVRVPVGPRPTLPRSTGGAR